MTEEGESTISVEKRKALEKLLDQNDFVLVHVNSKTPDLIVPQHLYREPSVAFQLSYSFRGALEIFPECVVADLLFAGKYQECTIPFESIWRLTTEDNQNVFWFDDAPKEFVDEFKQVAKSIAKEKADLKVAPEEPAAEKKTEMPTKGHLRRIK